MFELILNILTVYSPNTPSSCNITFSIDKTLKKPKIYYMIDNFYANHRNFVKSRIYKQMRGNDMEESKIS